MTRESLKDVTLNEVQTMLEADLVTYQEEIANLPKEELEAKEVELMEDFKEYDEYIKDVIYTTPNKIDYDGNTFKAGQVREKIIGFLNRIEVEFRATLGIYQAIRFWKTVSDSNVPYAVYDSTVRLLGTLKFKGEQDMLDVLVINNFFSSTHEEYTKDTVWIQYLSAKHNAILKAMEPEPAEGEPMPIPGVAQ